MDNFEDIIWTASNNERNHTLRTRWFIKRQLHDHELPLSPWGTIIRPLWDNERFRNEYAATMFIKQCTTIPVPECRLFVRDGLLHFASRRITNAIRLEDAPADLKLAAIAAVQEQLTRYILPQLNSMRRSYIGSVSRSIPVFPPARVYKRDDRSWERITADGDAFVFCHNDLSAKNIWINPETLKIESIIGWEHAGFFPYQFELPLWTAFGWASRQAMHGRALVRDLSLFGLSPNDLRNRVPISA